MPQFYFRYAAAKKLSAKVKQQQIYDHMSRKTGESLMVQAQKVLDTIIAYQASADFEINEDHVPGYHMDKNGLKIPVDAAWKKVSRVFDSVFTHI